MPIIVVAAGTSTAGKSSIAAEMKKLGYVIISLDDIFNETRPDLNRNMYASELNKKCPDRKEMCKRIRKAYKEGNNVFVDEVFASLITSQLSARSYKIMTVLVYAPLGKLTENYKARMFKDYRSMRGILAQFRSLYVHSSCKTPIDYITKKDIYKAASVDHRSFADNEDLKSFVDTMASDMKIKKGRKSITSREKYDLIVINDTTPDAAARIIDSFTKGF